MSTALNERGHSGAAAALSQAPRAERIGEPNPAGGDTPAGPFTHSQLSQLITLAACRNLELCQSIRLARMQLPGDSPGIIAFVKEREVNAAALVKLHLLRAALS